MAEHVEEINAALKSEKIAVLQDIVAMDFVTAIVDIQIVNM